MKKTLAVLILTLSAAGLSANCSSGKCSNYNDRNTYNNYSQAQNYLDGRANNGTGCKSGCNNQYYTRDNQDGNYQNENQDRNYQNYQDRTNQDRQDRNFQDRRNAAQDQRMQNNNQPGYYNHGDAQKQQDSQNGRTASQNDRDLNNKVQDALRSAFSNKYDNVTVNSKNGNVMLSGVVSSQDDKASLEQKVLGIAGVRSINNQVRVQN